MQNSEGDGRHEKSHTETSIQEYIKSVYHSLNVLRERSSVSCRTSGSSLMVKVLARYMPTAEWNGTAVLLERSARTFAGFAPLLFSGEILLAKMEMGRPKGKKKTISASAGSLKRSGLR